MIQRSALKRMEWRSAALRREGAGSDQGERCDESDLDEGAESDEDRGRHRGKAGRGRSWLAPFGLFDHIADAAGFLPGNPAALDERHHQVVGRAGEGGFDEFADHAAKGGIAGAFGEVDEAGLFAIAVGEPAFFFEADEHGLNGVAGDLATGGEGLPYVHDAGPGWGIPDDVHDFDLGVGEIGDFRSPGHGPPFCLQQ